MEDPTWAWPAWKFGMKRDDLFTTLHDQYNTFSFTLQDPEAFHHDVYEISRDADTAHEFHRMMADRRQMRLRELNESLETLAVEIIANPKLMGTEQWQHALQLFRTKSYDSIIRYFASYLPEDYLDRHDTHSTSSASFSETDTISTAASSVDDVPSPFMDDDFFPNGPVMTAEPDLIKEKPSHHHISHPHGPLSPPHTEDAQSEPSVSSPPSDAESNDYSTNPPSRSMSFSGSESGHLVPELIRRRYLEKEFDETSQSDECHSAVTSVCESVEGTSAADVVKVQSHPDEDAIDFDEDDDIPTAQYPDDEFDYLDITPSLISCDDTLDSDTPTPRPEAAAASYMEFRSVVSHSKKAPSYQRSPSPKCCLVSRGAGSLAREVRRSPEESLSKIQKSVQDFSRKRPKARRRVD
ncbi:hypothetical protein VFPPC_14493 [Pochonia chlamydosporia 170]|uniref:Uncharacterized protein n=1 Tax=Pochonia chlamydosporia 170 TaxID=1380566 RepID=A0A179FBJ0_METCM|nr:hypothetical protein VFPPC_14493 [Pochonia chlamydosporia 170]OAQ62915.1 hypothetical protein VFPPC_14493 [Pochonia chlamydosporia 170]